MKIGVAQAWEKGIHETIMQRYLGSSYKPNPDHTAASVTMPLVILVLILLGLVALIMSPTILIFENLCRKFKFTPDQTINDRCNKIYEEGICPQCGRKQIHQKLCID